MQNVFIYEFRVPPHDAMVNILSNSTLFTNEVNIAVLFQIINLWGHNLLSKKYFFKKYKKYFLFQWHHT